MFQLLPSLTDTANSMTHFGNLGWRVNIMTLVTIDGPMAARQIPYLVFGISVAQTQFLDPNANPVYDCP